MTLRLLVMRHGKSDWSAEYGADHDRPLAEKGIQSAQRMGRFLADGHQLPEFILSSTAQRARCTAELFAAGAGCTVSIEVSPDLYASTPSRVLAEVRQMTCPSPLMLVGHEPTWSQMVGELMGGGDLSFPTAAIARVDFECDRWSEIEMGQGLLKWLLQPKLIR